MLMNRLTRTFAAVRAVEFAFWEFSDSNVFYFICNFFVYLFGFVCNGLLSMCLYCG